MKDSMFLGLSLLPVQIFQECYEINFLSLHHHFTSIPRAAHTFQWENVWERAEGKLSLQIYSLPSDSPPSEEAAQSFCTSSPGRWRSPSGLVISLCPAIPLSFPRCSSPSWSEPSCQNWFCFLTLSQEMFQPPQHNFQLGFTMFVSHPGKSSTLAMLLSQGLQRRRWVCACIIYALSLLQCRRGEGPEGHSVASPKCRSQDVPRWNRRVRTHHCCWLYWFKAVLVQTLICPPVSRGRLPV